MDVTNPEEIRSTIDEILSAWGRLDILVNNAGINTLAHRVAIDQFPREEWDKILAVDITGLYEVSRAVAGVMRKQKSGRIINIASIVGLVPLRLQCAFVAAKAGVVNLTKRWPWNWPRGHSRQWHCAGLDVNGRDCGSSFMATMGYSKKRCNACSTTSRSADPRRWTKSLSPLSSLPTPKTPTRVPHR